MAGLWIKLVPKRDEKMVWKQDLAQFKQQLKPDQEPTGPPSPPPKPVPPPFPSQSLEDADLLFLRAMGGVAVPPAPITSNPMKETGKDASPTAVFPITLNNVPRALGVEESSGDFSQALGDLKGLRPLSKNPMFSAPSPSVALSAMVAIPQSTKVQAELPAPIPTPITTEELPAHLSSPDPDTDTTDTDTADTPIALQKVPHIQSGPVLMHLAAGMAIEVDGALDLRRHSLNDAKERLKERIRDGVALRWRTLLVTLGPHEALKQGFLAFLTTPQAQSISRYAQAPIPMGGAQAWVLYLGQQTQPIRKDDA